MNLKKKIFLCVAQGVEVARHKILFFLWQFFSTSEKINQFWEFCKDQGGKIQFKPFVLKLQSRVFLKGPSEKPGIEIESQYQLMGHPVNGIISNGSIFFNVLALENILVCSLD